MNQKTTLKPVEPLPEPDVDAPWKLGPANCSILDLNRLIADFFKLVAAIYGGHNLESWIEAIKTLWT